MRLILFLGLILLSCNKKLDLASEVQVEFSTAYIGSTFNTRNDQICMDEDDNIYLVTGFNSTGAKTLNFSDGSSLFQSQGRSFYIAKLNPSLQFDSKVHFDSIANDSVVNVFGCEYSSKSQKLFVSGEVYGEFSFGNETGPFVMTLDKNLQIENIRYLNDVTGDPSGSVNSVKLTRDEKLILQGRYHVGGSHNDFFSQASTNDNAFWFEYDFKRDLLIDGIQTTSIGEGANSGFNQGLLLNDKSKILAFTSSDEEIYIGKDRVYRKNEFSSESNVNYIAKLDKDNNLAWVIPYIAPVDTVTSILTRSLTDTGDGILLLISGNGFIFDDIEFSTLGKRDVFIIKLSYEGQIIWSKQLGGAGHEESFFRAIDIDERGNIYIAFRYAGTLTAPAALFGQVVQDGTANYLVTKLSSNGQVLWHHSLITEDGVYPALKYHNKALYFSGIFRNFAYINGSKVNFSGKRRHYVVRLRDP